MLMRYYWLAILVLILAACSLSGTDQGLVQRVEILETEVAQYKEYTSYQATQIGRQEEFIEYLATRGPAVTDGAYTQGSTPTFTPYDTWMGAVFIEGDKCCAGGIAGETVELTVEFLVKSNGGNLTEMRVLVGSVLSENIDQVSWEPYVQEKTYSATLATNWTTFWVHAQFRDSSGVVSEVYSDEIALEGMPPLPTDTPGN